MALLSLGRNVAIAENLQPVGPSVTDPTDVRSQTNKKLEDAQKTLLEALTPWIPGDFVVTYGILLTAWTGIRASFPWMLIVAAISAVSFVVLGAFAETGFKTKKDWSDKVRKRLAIRTIVGFLVAVYACVAIPNSGWYQLNWFKDNELSVVVTAGVISAILILALKGFQKRVGYSLGAQPSPPDNPPPPG